MNRLGFITGMQAEAAVLAAATAQQNNQSRPLIAVAGGDAERAETMAREFARAGVAGLVSFGIAGGLDPVLGSGALVLPDGILLPEGETIAADLRWRAALEASVTAVGGLVYGSDQAISDVRHKARLFEDTGAVAVDMESHGVARAARAVGLPYVVVRAIADPADRALPRVALAGLGPQGETRPFAVLAELLKRPTDLPALLRVARDSKVALRALAAVAPAVVSPF